jgi:hypothetical protein
MLYCLESVIRQPVHIWRHAGCSICCAPAVRWGAAALSQYILSRAEMLGNRAEVSARRFETPTQRSRNGARSAQSISRSRAAAAGSLRYSKQDELLYEAHNIVSLVRTFGPTRKMKIPDLVQPALALILLALITGKQWTRCCVRLRVLTKGACSFSVWMQRGSCGEERSQRQ